MDRSEKIRTVALTVLFVLVVYALSVAGIGLPDIP